MSHFYFSEDECDGNPMVSGFQVDLDPDDLQMGSGVGIVAEEEEEGNIDESELDEEKADSSNAKLLHCGLADLNLNSVDSEEATRASRKNSNISSPAESDVQGQQNYFLGSDSDPFSLKPTKAPSTIAGLRESEEEEKVDHLDDWLNSENTLVNPYVSTSNMMPEGASLEDSDAEEGKRFFCFMPLNMSVRVYASTS